MKKLNISDQDFTRIEKPDSPANNLVFDISLLMNNSKNTMSRWSVWTNISHDALYIEFNADLRSDIDMLELHLKRLENNYSFSSGFVNPSTLVLSPFFRGIDPKGILYIENILYRTTATA